MGEELIVAKNAETYGRKGCKEGQESIQTKECHINSRIAKENTMKNETLTDLQDDSKCKHCGAVRIKGGSANCWKCGSYIGIYKGETDKQALSDMLFGRTV